MKRIYPDRNVTIALRPDVLPYLHGQEAYGVCRRLTNCQNGAGSGANSGVQTVHEQAVLKKDETCSQDGFDAPLFLGVSFAVRPATMRRHVRE